VRARVCVCVASALSPSLLTSLHLLCRRRATGAVKKVAGFFGALGNAVQQTAQAAGDLTKAMSGSGHIREAELAEVDTVEEYSPYVRPPPLPGI
jgi:hypothetical protein